MKDRFGAAMDTIKHVLASTLASRPTFESGVPKGYFIASTSPSADGSERLPSELPTNQSSDNAVTPSEPSFGGFGEQNSQYEERCSLSSDSISTDFDSVDDSEFSDDVPFMDEEHPLLRNKEPILNAILQAFDSWKSCPQANGSQSSQNSGYPSRTFKEKQYISGSKRDRDDRGDDADGRRNDEGEGSNAKRLRQNDVSPRRPRLACPFYKKDPIKHRECLGKVISTIAYLKQHLKRYHQLPLYCSVCKTIFPNETDRDRHSEARSCDLRTDIVHDGVTTDQRKLLAKRVPPAVGEARQWFGIFDILFPEFLPQPKSAYINADLSADMESFQDFIPLSGPDIILEVMASRGLRIFSDSLHEADDIATFARIVLSDGLQHIADRWNEAHIPDTTVPPGSGHEDLGESGGMQSLSSGGIADMDLNQFMPAFHPAGPSTQEHMSPSSREGLIRVGYDTAALENMHLEQFDVVMLPRFQHTDTLQEPQIQQTPYLSAGIRGLEFSIVAADAVDVLEQTDFDIP
jgi:hypothetical protein